MKAYVYTSSGPIIAGTGGSYDHADETHPTLAVIRKGDPYHVAKALGDELVLNANRKHGIRTACIRPTALYGDGDEQMIIPTLELVKNGQVRVAGSLLLIPDSVGSQTHPLYPEEAMLTPL